MQKIILLSFDYPPNNGGISRLCAQIVAGFQDRKIDYHVVTNVAGATSDPNVTRITGRRYVQEFKILRWIKRNTSKSDIIICDTWHPAGTIAILSGRKFFVLAHGAEFLPGKTLLRSKVIPPIRRKVLSKAQAIIANSHYTTDLVNSLKRGLNAIAIPLAIDANQFVPTTEKSTDDVLRLCSIARLEKFKGHDFVIETIASMTKEEQAHIRLEIAGKGPYKAALEKLVKERGLEAQVKFLGYLPEEEMCDFYSRNDLFILCTREEKDNCNVEGFGLVFVEAQACGTAVIGTKAGGIPDAINPQKGGWLIEQDNKEELLELLRHGIHNIDEIRKEGSRARQRVMEEYGIVDYMSKLLDTINA